MLTRFIYFSKEAKSGKTKAESFNGPNIKELVYPKRCV